MINLISNILNKWYRESLENEIEEEKKAEETSNLYKNVMDTQCEPFRYGQTGSAGLTGVCGPSGFFGSSPEVPIDYVKYLESKVDSCIKYSDYLAENLDKSIQYTEYIAERLNCSWMGDYAKAHATKVKRVVSSLDPYGEENWEE